MKVLLCAFLFCISFSIAKDDFRTVSSCDGSMRSGSFVFVDMNKIGRPCTCTCTVNSLFVGDLLVTSLKVTPLCNTKLTVNNTVIFYCNEAVSSTFKVGVNDILIVKAEHLSGNIKDNFNQCVGFSENDVIELSAAGGIVLLVILVVCSFIMLRRRNRNNKAESPEVHITLSFKVFDSSNELPDNPLYNSCQTVEKVESHVASKQNQQIASLQQTALNTMHRIDPDYDVPSNNKPIDQDASSMSLYEVSNTKSIKRDLLHVPMPLYAVPNNRFINRGPSPTPMYAVPQENHERLPEVKDVDANKQYYSTAKNPV